MIEAVNAEEIRLTSCLLDSDSQDALYARVQFLLSNGWTVSRKEYRPASLMCVVTLVKVEPSESTASALGEAF